MRVGKSQNDGYTVANKYYSQYKCASFGDEDQSVTYSRGEALGSNVHMKRSERIISSSWRYNPGFGAAREWNNDDVASIVYMIQDRDLNRNVHTDDILL